MKLIVNSRRKKDWQWDIIELIQRFEILNHLVGKIMLVNLIAVVTLELFK